MLEQGRRQDAKELYTQVTPPVLCWTLSLGRQILETPPSDIGVRTVGAVNLVCARGDGEDAADSLKLIKSLPHDDVLKQKLSRAHLATIHYNRCTVLLQQHKMTEFSHALKVTSGHSSKSEFMLAHRDLVSNFQSPLSHDCSLWSAACEAKSLSKQMMSGRESM